MLPDVLLSGKSHCVTLKDPIERGLKVKANARALILSCGVTLKDPIERGLKVNSDPVLTLSTTCYTQRPDRKGTESMAVWLR